MASRPASLNLSNWRLPPHGEWSFHHVREIIPSELIGCGSEVSALPSQQDAGIDAVRFSGYEDQPWELNDWLEASSTDALLVAHRGNLVHEWYSHADIETHPHIVFSVSKSITATLAGVLIGEGLLDPSKPVVDIIPELAGSGYHDATLQHVLDMQVRLDFNEDYLATTGKFVEYRTSTAWHPCGVDEIDLNLHQFLCSIGRAEGDHGETWQYRSPNSDLLGWVLERASGERLADLLSTRLWQPMGAEADAYVTVDRKGAARSAGGICVLPRDLLRFAELVRNRGAVDGRQIIPESWIEDCSDGGSLDAWKRGESAKDFPAGQYRNKWYQSGNEHRAMLAIGIHSQWVYIDPVAEVTIVKLSSQDTPLKLELDAINLHGFETICAAF
jgi:CubicO group peptidase (beta-lactamase class C family)